MNGRRAILPLRFEISRAARAAAGTALLLGSLRCATVPGSDATSVSGGDQGVELGAVISTVKEAIGESETRDVRGFPPLKKVVLKLQTSVSKTAAGSVRYLVATLSGRTAADTVSLLELTLTPAETAPRRAIAEGELKDALAQAIHAAKIGVAEAAKGEPAMQMSGISIDLKFTVSAGGSAGANARIQLLPVGLQATGAISRERQHEVHLVFGAS